ncbi:hypothetical protein CGCS363_v002668 [Colletotrichum siamense]|uniref:uncharacterized protein n=1 Tax=Colletotrichum siamense TaxID=690259 RepID=UPI00187316C5|nr:uncharacterized protein CGCS363_v002668 [Colletotrichum siamense]KAF5510935.1 hypothetical protein CGCS363_v002668 [Colletotrichum siamense]
MGTPGLFVNEASPRPQSSPIKQDDEDDDDISVTSSLESQHDSDEEWSVEQILYQTTEDGKEYYLVEWTGYPLERATWEPPENASSILLDEWKATQEKQRRGDEPEFDIKGWYELCEDFQRNRFDRHQERNRLRIRRGLRPTLWEGESKEDYYSSDDDVSQDDFNDILPPPKTSKRQIDQALPSIEDRPKQSLKQAAERNASLPRKRASSGEKSKSPTKQKSPALASQRPPTASAVSKPTGYQGTARKPTVTRVSSTKSTGSLTTLASKFSKPAKTAKKTQPGARTMVKAAGNIFTSGKPIRVRSRLSDNAADTNQSPRAFTNHRIRRKAELQGRDKADQAPPIIPSTLFSISGGPPPQSNTSNAIAKPKSVLKRPADDLAPRSASESSITASEAVPSTSEQSQPSRPPAKKRKSVQWDPQIPFTDEPEDMDVNSSSTSRPKRLKSPPQPTISHQPQPLEPQQVQPTLKKLSIADYQNRGKTFMHSLDKNIEMGPRGSKQIQVTFDNLRIDPEKWYSEVEAQDILHFSTTFHVRIFVAQRPVLFERVLSQGAVNAISSEGEGAIKSAAEKLKVGSFGAACLHEDFSIIVYPASCDEWKSAMKEVDDLNYESSPSDVALRYLIYKPHHKPIPEQRPIASSLTDKRASILQTLLGLDYHRLMPTGLKDVRHNFYLAFPPSREAMLDTVSEWLHMENPHCRVFSSKTSGDWRAFMDPKIANHGVVIFHETTVDVIHRYPSILKLLVNKKPAHTFWCLGESLRLRPAYPSIRSAHDITEVGAIELTRLFPHGSAILVTPSFLVAEPQRALQLFDWYKKTHAKPSANTKIVAAASLSKFLQGIALDRADQMRSMLAGGSTQDAVERAGLGYDDCMARFETWTAVESFRQSFMESIEADEQLEPIIFAPECIDANDEQSLVNWFGCWSQTRYDQFRKFFVLGTDRRLEARHSIKYEDLPLYSPGTDHDLAAEGEPNPAAQPGDGPSSVDRLLPMGTTRLASWDPRSITPFLMDLSKRMGNTRTGKPPKIIAKAYGFTVGYYQDVEATADSFRDFYRELKTYKQWLEFPWPFYSKMIPVHAPKHTPELNAPKLFNTYISLFYTPQGQVAEHKWEGRHPWIAVYRPEHPTIRPWEGSEIVIWDVSARINFPTESQIPVSRLNHAQKHLIEFVEEHGRLNNPDLPLTRVWLGGEQPSGDILPLDATLDALETMCMNPDQATMPEEKDLIENGFRPVVLRAQNDAQTHTGSPSDMELDPTEDLFAEEDDPKSKTIFHPPRSPRPIRASRCENLLFKWVKDVARRDSSRSVFSYTFTPTVEWYERQQLAENRNFEHIYVGSWKNIFDWLRIPEETTYKRIQDRKETSEDGRR